MVVVSNNRHGNGTSIILFALRTKLDPGVIEQYAATIKIAPLRDVKDHMRILADQAANHRYDAFVAGSLTQIWQEVLTEVRDGRGKAFFVTIPKFDPDVTEFSENLKKYTKLRGNEIEGILVAKESHTDGDKHVHALIKTEEPCRFNLDELWTEIGAVGNIQRVVDEQRVSAYILKGYTENSSDYYASGNLTLPANNEKHSFNDILDTLIQKVIHQRQNPNDFLTDKAKNVRLTAFRNRKALEQLWFETMRQNAQVRVPFIVPVKPRDPTFVPIWDWIRKLHTGELRDPRNPSRHLFLSGSTGTRKSSLGTFLSRSFNVFHFDVNDEYYDGYADGKDIGICDEFHIDKPGRGKDLPNLNRFLEGAAGQLLNIKYQKSAKYDVTLPCLFISNLNKQKIYEVGTRYFDIEIVKAFLRRFVFVDIGTKTLPGEFTVLGKPQIETETKECQTDFEYLPPFIFTSPVVFDHICLSSYLAFTRDHGNRLLDKSRLAFSGPEEINNYDYFIVSKNKQSKNIFSNPYISTKTAISDSSPILSSRSLGFWGCEIIATYVVQQPDCKDDKETNCAIFPKIHALNIGLIKLEAKGQSFISRIEPHKFFVSIDTEGKTSIMFNPEFLLSDIENTSDATSRAINPKIRPMCQIITQFRSLLGNTLMLLQGQVDCIICQETKDNPGVILACSHMYHIECFVNLLKVDFQNCPLCKTDINSLEQVQTIYLSSKRACHNQGCTECENPWKEAQNIVGCSCKTCLTERKEAYKIIFPN